MFSNLASFIFGSTVEDAQQPEVPDNDAPSTPPEKMGEEEEWVLVGDAPPTLTLASLSEIIPRPTTGSTGSSDPPSDSEDSADVVLADNNAGEEPEARDGAVLTRTGRRLTVPFGSISGVTSLSEIRCLRAAQASKLKDSGKHLSAKALDRRNKAVKHHQGGVSSRKGKAPTMALKASGSSRHLKQC